jgi:molybdenum cofactor biosynthesis enzyme MoaA
MIAFQRLEIGTAQKAPCVLCGRDSSSVETPHTLEEISSQIQRLDTSAVMMDGFEPFKHPELVRIIETLSDAAVTRIGMRTNGAALQNPQNAFGCIDAGVRVFEIPIVAGESEKGDRLTGIAGSHEASLQGIARIKEASKELNVATFTVAVLRLCRHNAGDILAMTRAAIRAEVDAIRLEAGQPVAFDESALSEAHSAATQAGIAFFGTGCERFLEGATLYTVEESSL